MAWITEESDIAKDTEDLVLKYNPKWTGGRIDRYVPAQIPEWAEDLFIADNLEGFDVNVSFSRKSWHGRMKSCRGIGASSLSDEEISTFENELWEYLQKVPETFDILHFVTLLNLRAK
jgi:hypothetical protein